MGYYVNPGDKTKEEWLAEHGSIVSEEQAVAWEGKDHLPVCLVDNGAFTAAGIAYDRREAEHFARPDGRPKIWWIVPRADLEPFMR